MSIHSRADVLSDLVIEEVPVDVRASMSEVQIKAVRSAARKRHSVDVRITVPLFFTQLYVVFLVGKDTRSNTVAVQRERRHRAGFHLSSFAIGVLATVAVIAAAIVLYVVKSKAGINIFPGHLRDFVPFAN